MHLTEKLSHQHETAKQRQVIQILIRVMISETFRLTNAQLRYDFKQERLHLSVSCFSVRAWQTVKWQITASCRGRSACLSFFCQKGWIKEWHHVKDPSFCSSYTAPGTYAHARAQPNASVSAKATKTETAPDYNQSHSQWNTSLNV